MMTHFEVKNYKCLVDCSLPLTPLHVIIGQNDSGKTSLLEAILALHKSAEVPLADAFPGQWDGDELVFEGSAKPEVEFRAKFEDPAKSPSALEYHVAVQFHSKGRSCIATDEWYQYSRYVPVKQRGWHSHLSGLASRLTDQTQSELDNRELVQIAEIIGDAQLYQLDPKAMAEPCALDPDRMFRLERDGFGLPGLLDDISGYEPQLFLAIRREFCSYFPQFKTVRLQTEQGLSRQLAGPGVQTSSQGPGKGIYFDTLGGHSIRAQHASDGAILFLGLLALMNSPKSPKVLLIEEPEKGVYPKRLAKVIDMLRELEAGTRERPVPQMIITTHSPYLLSSFKPHEVTFLRRESDTGPVRAWPLRNAPHIQERLEGDEFYLGELWYNLSEEELFADA